MLSILLFKERLSDLHVTQAHSTGGPDGFVAASFPESDFLWQVSFFENKIDVVREP
jgi:hypothetical protein